MDKKKDIRKKKKVLLIYVCFKGSEKFSSDVLCSSDAPSSVVCSSCSSGVSLLCVDMLCMGSSNKSDYALYMLISLINDQPDVE
ncbi:hypothetical protein L195_g051071 [Trifolium pratense]|uniref:Uncharacterized protein n=1 Tax=Trifolium pratense TaxID=57577 RepID=A0A2K3JXK7_TRIPR|nr:hypothetical protein L195_g051071 [Trifolium pratense]